MNQGCKRKKERKKEKKERKKERKKVVKGKTEKNIIQDTKKE